LRAHREPFRLQPDLFGAAELGQRFLVTWALEENLVPELLSLAGLAALGIRGSPPRSALLSDPISPSHWNGLAGPVDDEIRRCGPGGRLTRTTEHRQ
jgi:hypothetical protein